MKKLTYIIPIIIIISILLLIFLINDSFAQLSNHDIQMQMVSDKLLGNQLKSEIDDEYFHTKQDAIFFALSLSSDIDVLSEETQADNEAVKDITENLFSRFYRTNGFYKQITYLNAQGTQIAAVDGKGHSISLDNIKDFSDKYFQFAKKKQAWRCICFI